MCAINQHSLNPRKKMRQLLFVAASAFIITSSPSYAATPNGLWLSADGRVKVKLTECQNALCGRIVWLKQPIDPLTRHLRTDSKNPDASKRARKLLGLKVVSDLRQSGENKWSGSIYNADDGRSYDVNVRLVGEQKLALEGCALGI